LDDATIIDFALGTCINMAGKKRRITVVGDLEKLSRALSEGTPEKLAEREINRKAVEIGEALRRDGVYVDTELGVRISADSQNR
jgi:hypothetical protein